MDEGRPAHPLSPPIFLLTHLGPSPTLLTRTPLLRVYTGDAGLDAEFTAREYLFVLVGYRGRRLHPIGASGSGGDR